MELEFDELPSEEIRPGDLVFVLAAQDDGLEQFTADLTSTHWSHVGIACDDGLVASVRCDTAPLALGVGGGARLDPLWWYREELGRPVFVGRVGAAPGAPEDPRFGERRAQAAEFARRLTRHDTAPHTRFSFTKTLVAGIACYAGSMWPGISTEAVVEMLAQLDVVGQAWTATPRHLAFSSAEFVATAYALPFTRASLSGPIIIRTEDGPPVDQGALAGELIREQHAGRRSTELAHLLDLMERYEPIVLREVVETFGTWWRQGAGAPALVSPPASSPKHDPVPGAERQIAAALVSTRILADAPWVEKIYYAEP